MAEERRAGRRRLGAALIAVGIAVILAGVFTVLNAAGGPEGRRFENRRSYDQVKTDLHAAYPVGLAIGIGGLAVALLGGRLRR